MHELQPVKVDDDTGFTLIELMLVVAIIALIAAIAVPNLLRARISGNEASGIGSIRTIGSAEVTFASTCGGGGYAITLADLGLAPTAGGPAFIPGDLAAASAGGTPNSGYEFTITGTGDVILLAADTCNGAGSPTESEFFAIADPGTPGSTGIRFFGTDHSGQIRQHSAQLADMTDGIPLQ